MTDKKLSASMQKALDALPLQYSTWGSQTFSSSFPKGVTMATIRALQKRGLVKIVRTDPKSSLHKTVKKVETNDRI